MYVVVGLFVGLHLMPATFDPAKQGRDEATNELEVASSELCIVQ